jgi:hypothetical protein
MTKKAQARIIRKLKRQLKRQIAKIKNESSDSTDLAYGQA